MLNINCKYIYLLLTGAGWKDLPSEILVQIFQYLTIQDCLRGVGRVCRRFQGLIEYTGEVWRTLETDVELSTEVFQSIMRHAKLIRKLGLRFSQKRLRYASPDMYIESYLACCVNVCWLDQYLIIPQSFRWLFCTVCTH